jgi:hypothetical protein
MAIIAEFVMSLHDDGQVTVSGFHSEAAQHAAAVQAVQTAMPGAQVVEDPWAGIDASPAPPAQPVAYNGPPPQQQGQQWPQQPAQSAPQPTYGTPPQAQPQNAPACVHGPLKVIPGGFSQKTQKAYAAFWACQGPRGQQCKLDRNQLPPIPA